MPKNNPLKVSLTGGIGAGKSVVARVFEILGVPVFNADKEAKQILASPEVREKIIELLGSESFVDGNPDREFIAAKVFSNESLRKGLNSIIHPAVGEAFKSFCNKHKKSDYVIKEAAISIETGAYRQMDATILVTAPEHVRIQRVKERDGITEEKVKERIKAQWSDEEKLTHSQFHIKNDGVEPLIPVVLQIHNTLKRAASDE